MADFGFSDRSAERHTPVIWFATIFALTTYAAVSMRAKLNPYEVNALIDTKRAVSILAGALIFWLAMRTAERLADQAPRAQIHAILRVSLPGIVLLFLARETYDIATSGQIAMKLALNLRWMLTWVGYFTAGASAFVALCYHRRLTAILAGSTPIAKSQAATGRSEPSVSAVDWAIDALADEIAAGGTKTRSELLSRLEARAGYASAEGALDPATRVRTARLATIDILRSRLVADGG